jgi:hypothetical protein
MWNKRVKDHLVLICLTFVRVLVCMRVYVGVPRACMRAYVRAFA